MIYRVAMRNRCVSAILTVIPLVCGCGGGEESAPPAGEELLAPPPAGQGVQYKMVTQLDAGVEAEHCMFVQAPPEGLFINRDQVRYTTGSHHFLLYETAYTSIPTQNEDGTPIDTSGVFDCSNGPTLGWKIVRLIGGSQNASGGSFVEFPENVAMRVPPNAVLLMNAHYINASGEPIEPEVRINLFTVPESQVEQEGDILFLYNAFIKAPAQGQGRARMRCKVHKDITVMNVQSHMHARGVDYAVSELDAEPFYTNTAWQDVPVKHFPGGLSLKAGSTLDYHCDYDNPGTTDVYQGPRSTDEMCMVIGSYYPADQQTAQCASSADDPLRTQGIGAEWVGNGTATCAETQACVQQTFGSPDIMKGIADCIDASDPAVAKEMSDALRCLFSQLNPATACQAEFAACAAK